MSTTLFPTCHVCNMLIKHEEAVADGETLWLFAYGSLVSSPEGVAAPEEIVDEAQ